MIGQMRIEDRCIMYYIVEYWISCTMDILYFMFHELYCSTYSFVVFRTKCLSLFTYGPGELLMFNSNIKMVSLPSVDFTNKKDVMTL